MRSRQPARLTTPVKLLPLVSVERAGLKNCQYQLRSATSFQMPRYMIVPPPPSIEKSLASYRHTNVLAIGRWELAIREATLAWLGWTSMVLL